MLGHLNVHFGMVILDPGAKKLKKRVGAPNDSQPLIEKQCGFSSIVIDTIVCCLLSRTEVHFKVNIFVNM